MSDQETEEKNAKKTTRVQLELPPKAMKRLVSLKERTEAASYAEVVRNALVHYEAFMNNKGKQE